jgi:hypothetical protein
MEDVKMQVEIDEKTWAALLVVVLTGEPPSPQREYAYPENAAYYDAAGILGDFIAKYRPSDVRERPNLVVVTSERNTK